MKLQRILSQSIFILGLASCNTCTGSGKKHKKTVTDLKNRVRLYEKSASDRLGIIQKTQVKNIKLEDEVKELKKGNQQLEIENQQLKKGNQQLEKENQQLEIENQQLADKLKDEGGYFSDSSEGDQLPSTTALFANTSSESYAISQQ